MKTRLGFVSNSSSSSFMVSAKKQSDFKVSLVVDLRQYGEVLKTKEAAIEYFDEDGNGDDTERSDALAAIECGECVLVGVFSDEGDDDMERLLCHTGLDCEEMAKQGVTVISSEADY